MKSKSEEVGGVAVGGSGEVSFGSWQRMNPWPSSLPPGRSPKEIEPDRAPAEWYILSKLAAETIGGAIFTVLRDHPDRRKPRDLDWLQARVRERLTALRESGDVGGMAAIKELDGGRLCNARLIYHGLAHLISAGDVLATLRKDRDAMDWQIQRLEALGFGG